MTDSKLKSLTECIVNIIPGFGIAYFSNLFILPHYSEGIANSDGITMLIIGVWYTAISIVRSYAFRRIFNRVGNNENFYTILKKGIEKYSSNSQVGLQNKKEVI